MEDTAATMTNLDTLFGPVDQVVMDLDLSIVSGSINHFLKYLIRGILDNFIIGNIYLQDCNVRGKARSTDH